MQVVVKSDEILGIYDDNIDLMSLYNTNVEIKFIPDTYIKIFNNGKFRKFSEIYKSLPFAELKQSERFYLKREFNKVLWKKDNGDDRYSLAWNTTATEIINTYSIILSDSNCLNNISLNWKIEVNTLKDLINEKIELKTKVFIWQDTFLNYYYSLRRKIDAANDINTLKKIQWNFNYYKTLEEGGIPPLNDPDISISQLILNYNVDGEEKNIIKEYIQFLNRKK